MVLTARRGVSETTTMASVRCLAIALTRCRDLKSPMTLRWRYFFQVIPPVDFDLAIRN
jgi:hypothetical protein